VTNTDGAELQGIGQFNRLNPGILRENQKVFNALKEFYFVAFCLHKLIKTSLERRGMKEHVDDLMVSLHERFGEFDHLDSIGFFRGEPHLIKQAKLV
jgi:hypothetical protein